jgi:hypothetical protein
LITFGTINYRVLYNPNPEIYHSSGIGRNPYCLARLFIV